MRFGDGAAPPQRPGREERNLSEYRNIVVIPADSTQELCAIIRISHALRPEIQPGLHEIDKDGAHPGDDSNQAPPLSEEQNNSLGHIINRRQSDLAAKLRVYTSTRANQRRERMALASELLASSIDLGTACTIIGWIGEARYHFYVAYLIALAAHGESSIISIRTCLQYAECLDDNEWHAEALKAMENLLNISTIKKAKEKETVILSRQIRGQVASIYLKIGDFEKAEAMYETVLSELPMDESSLIARYMERIAWAQAHQDRNESARNTYVCLLDEQSSQRQTVLSNLAFIMRRLGRFQEAKSLYAEAASLSGSNNTSGFTYLCAQSGLFSCLNKFGSEDEISRVSKSLIQHLNMNLLLSGSPPSVLQVNGDALDFAISRQLESLLAICSIPVRQENGVSGVALVDADPLNVLYEGRGS